ncbi:MAG: hypothetical protein COA57_14295, partial [Flavobacteriales bacterium]
GKSFATFTTAQGLANNNVYSITEDKDGNLWFGTEEGLSVKRVDGEKLVKNNDKIKKAGNKRKQLFINFTKTDGLPDNFICAIREDEQGNIIIGNNFGLCVIPVEEAKRITGSVAVGKLSGLEVYNQFTGYPVRDVNTGGDNGTMHVDSKGILWVGHGSNGVARVDLEAVHKSQQPPVVVIQSVKVNEENICWYSMKATNSESQDLRLKPRDSLTLVQQEVMTYGKVLGEAERDTVRKQFSGVEFDGITRFYPMPENLVLPYDYNHLTFEYNAIETGRYFLVNYQYMLEGQDEKWSPVTKKTDVTYGNLYEGNYTFLLKAQSPWGVWSEPTAYTFTVLPPWYRNRWAYSAYALLLVAGVFLLVWANGRRLRARAKELAEEVRRATVEITEQKEEIEKQKKEVEKTHEQLAEHHKEITDSIAYAKRIQDAMLASEEHDSQHLPEHYILFKPKDVVSGDYYWALEKQGYLYLTAADCTGHGVPGAFMSMLGMSFLNEINAHGELLMPAEILDELRARIIKELGQTGASGESKDGMDMSLLRLNLDTHELMWAGANNPLYHIKALDGNETEKDTVNETHYVEVILPDKQSIGFGYDMKPFTNHELTLQKGDSIVLFTDGFADQFGGEKGKKFKYKPFKKLLLKLKDQPLDEQKEIINTEFDNWKGGCEQVDDVCIIGIRV